MSTNVFESAATFKQCFWHKSSFVLLNQFDLLLTLFAVSLGFSELNPFMRIALNSPIQAALLKIAIPVLIAWLIPGKLLLPAVILLAFVVGWDVKELIVYFF